MAITTVRSLHTLDRGWVLAPERYDPRRDSTETSGRFLREIAKIASDTVGPNRSLLTDNGYLVFDTGDAQEGLLRVRRQPVAVDQIGSAKKMLQVGDVIISRLRPYLRQIAYIDPQVRTYYGSATLLASTEFFVLRPIDSSDIAFLVPWLLTRAVQDILAISQEGGHHPRFTQETLESLKIPSALLENRKDLSNGVLKAIKSIRAGDQQLRKLIEESRP